MALDGETIDGTAPVVEFPGILTRPQKPRGLPSGTAPLPWHLRSGGTLGWAAHSPGTLGRHPRASRTEAERNPGAATFPWHLPRAAPPASAPVEGEEPRHSPATFPWHLLSGSTFGWSWRRSAIPWHLRLERNPMAPSAGAPGFRERRRVLLRFFRNGAKNFAIFERLKEATAASGGGCWGSGGPAELLFFFEIKALRGGAGDALWRGPPHWPIEIPRWNGGCDMGAA